MEIVLKVDKRIVGKLRALAAECGVELEELAAEGLRALVDAAPRERRRRSSRTSTPAPSGETARSSSDEPRVVWNGARAGVGGAYLVTEG